MIINYSLFLYFECFRVVVVVVSFIYFYSDFFDDSFKTVYILFVLYFILPCLGLLCAVQNESC